MDTVVYVNKISKFSIQSTKIMFGICFTRLPWKQHKVVNMVGKVPMFSSVNVYCCCYQLPNQLTG